MVLLPSVPLARSAEQTVAAKPASAANVAHLANLDYKGRYGNDLPFGTDIELATLQVAEHGVTRALDVAFAGTYRNGLQIIDVTNPKKPALLSVYDCGLAQGDVQVFRRGVRTYVAYTADDYESETVPESRCFRDNHLKGIAYGTFIIDVTNPREPGSVTFVPFERGSHNQSVHPSGNYLYNSNADLGAAAPPAIEVVDIRNLLRPKRVAELPLLTGLDSHDITFSRDGTRAYTAALTHTLILDTSNPAAPSVLGRIIDPTVNIHHQADPVTIDDPLLGRRTFLVVTDELAGAAGNLLCPGGGLHVYDITGDLEQLPLKVGFFDIPDLSLTTGSSITCTSHVLRMYPEHGLMTIAWYARGVRVIDISSLVGVSIGLPGPGLREVGHLWFDDSNTWSAKALRIEPNGSFYLFGNDMNRGLDVYRFTAAPGGVATMSTGASRWSAPDALAPVAAAATGLAAGRSDRPLTVSCLLPR